MSLAKSLLLLFLFLSINIAVYSFTEVNSQKKIEIVLQNKLTTLKNHYDVLYETQKETANAVSLSTQNISRVLEIMDEANTASILKQKSLREELEELLKFKYSVLQTKGILQYQFILKNNISFYRAHKPSKFGDDLTGLREDIAYTNKHHKAIRGFEQGKTTHGFRNIFPLFNKDKEYIGALEVSYPSERIQWYLNNISGIHSHFLVNKNILAAKKWSRNDSECKYEQSAEAEDYMLALGDIHTQEKCIDQNIINLSPVRDEINSKLLQAKPFSTYFHSKSENNINVISFFPIHNIYNEVVAWIVSYEKDDFIHSTLDSITWVRIITLLTSLLLIYFLYKQIVSKQELEEKNKNIEKQHKLLDDILNQTDNIMLITDFTNISYSNDRCKEMLNLKDRELFNPSSNYTMQDIFIATDGYLHKGLLRENESFVSLISRTPPKDRLVSILDTNFEPAAFKISVTKSESNGDYLVTLSDITKIREHQIQTEKKVYLDGLTGINNRNKFNEMLDYEIQNSKRYDNTFSIAIIDIDYFKNFNDKYGHLIGDEVLITMAQTLNRNVRESDVFARWGGEEFVILFKNCNVTIAQTLSENLRNHIQNNTHLTAGKITASFGVTGYLDGDTMESIFERCDKALYKAKENGRNRVEVL